MASSADVPKRNTYRHGNLRNALIQAGLELARDSGPDAVILREATRRAGVVPNAAYRHFADRRALLRAVSQAALARLASAMETELAALPAADDPAESARARIRALATGYLRFAQAEPGLFRAAFSTTEMDDTGGESATGAGGLTAFQLLGAALEDLVETGVLPSDRRPGAEYFVWSAVHGLAVLLIDGPLRGLLPGQAREAEQRLMDSIERGI
ncbi:TetR/AcrR family transcriptional regulator [Streptosporangium sp. NBC_01756]|uniref:TetR/AcrR family transcriptional regulator n=1 Tax=Streptosporangium sp. NBC_01756 TaxID=2975950 RepID=UPI002DD8F99C|nr:TetR/AcrR family transcriptional regulator [Streptosporangium sp. NBC_01756]WSC89879.1 TetR/AcrR family transcriptional regulator [Streptosporangium sp. NBC_01756]